MKQYSISGLIKFYLLTLLYAVGIVIAGFKSAGAQQPQYMGVPNQLIQFKGGVKVDSIFLIPVRDTTAWTGTPTTKCGRLTLKIRPNIDTILYFNNCVKWMPVGSGTGTGISLPIEMTDVNGLLDTLGYYVDFNSLTAYGTSWLSQVVKLTDSIGGGGTPPYRWATARFIDSAYMRKNRTITINGNTQNISDNPVFTVAGGSQSWNDVLTVDNAATQSAYILNSSAPDKGLYVQDGPQQKAKITYGTTYGGVVWVENVAGSNVSSLHGDSLIVADVKLTSANPGVIAVKGDFVTEIPAGLINGSNTSFTITFTPSGAGDLFRNGVLQAVGGGNDYTISGTTITTLFIPASGEKLLYKYIKQ